MLKDPNVERYIKEAIKPLLQRIKKLESDVFKLKYGKAVYKKSKTNLQ